MLYEVPINGQVKVSQANYDQPDMKH